VPVVFSDGSGLKKRPVIIVFDSGDADLLVAPATSQAARSPRDVPLVNWQRAGLRLPSIVRLENWPQWKINGSQENGASRAG
jgi:hypothetical protein